jgi:hypothetical protein
MVEPYIDHVDPSTHRAVPQTDTWPGAELAPVGARALEDRPEGRTGLVAGDVVVVVVVEPEPPPVGWWLGGSVPVPGVDPVPAAVVVVGAGAVVVVGGDPALPTAPSGLGPTSLVRVPSPEPLAGLPSTWTAPKVTLLVRLGLCEVTATPARRLLARAGIYSDEPEILVHVSPSVETMAVNVEPERTALT